MIIGAGAANGARTWLTSLARDTRGNTLAIVAAAIFPLAGMIGGGVDISRMYIVKTRLQHACDAGALAGRKAMGGGSWTQTENGIANYPKAMADKFFDGNYDSAAYGATTVTRTFTESAGKVTGSASATVPMTLMQIFGKRSETLTVVCDAEMRLPNTDVMFVLDTTGSMNEDDGTGTRKINGLKFAVKCFYQIIARLDVTDADCEGDEPSGGTGNQVQIRFGFVPYATNVNVGRLLKPEWMVDSWDYQTRQNLNVAWEWSEWQDTSIRCRDKPGNSTSVEYRELQDRWGRCDGIQRRYSGPKWRYDKLPVNVSGLKNGTDWNDSFTLPIGDFATNKTIRWDGCIEERKTDKGQTDFDPIPSAATDLDIDSLPTSDDTRWKPLLPDLIYTRRSGVADWDRSRWDTATNYANTSGYYCPTPAKKMQEWKDAAEFRNYVNSLTPSGNTYHDIGLIWGARLLSPTGLFASENALTAKGAEIERHLIFMTDGDTNTSNRDYNAYGIPWFDQRQIASTSNGDLDGQVDARFAGLCTAIKNRVPNITLWVISFGSVSTETETRLTNCADTGRYFAAGNSAVLQEKFREIAEQISQLRLTK